MTLLAAFDRAAFAQAAPSVSGTLANGDTFTLTLNGDGGFTIAATGPQPFTLTGTIAINGNILTLTGVETVGSSPVFNINCTINTVTDTVSGTCGDFAFGGAGSPIGASIIGTSHATVRAQVQSIVSVLMNRIGSISRDAARARSGGDQSTLDLSSYSGISAGSADKNWGVWADGSGSYLKNTSSVAAFQGHGVTALTGIDYVYRDTWVMGFSAGYVRTDVFVNALQGTRLSQGASLGPYLSYIVNGHFTIDGLFTYNRLANDTNGFSVSSFNSDRYTSAINLNAFYDVRSWRLTGIVGYAYAFELPDQSAPSALGGLPTTIHYGSFNVGGEVAYPMGRFEPYLPITVEYETTETRDGTGRSGVVLGAGARYQIQDTIKAGFLLTAEEFRIHSQNYSASANVRVQF
ncbi:MAG TPA: autotransporter domain-containing protein [Stellaceae bacterium]|nr:autotransporter domain-containing protein [Stellaceae bacterium]